MGTGFSFDPKPGRSSEVEEMTHTLIKGIQQLGGKFLGGAGLPGCKMYPASCKERSKISERGDSPPCTRIHRLSLNI